MSRDEEQSLQTHRPALLLLVAYCSHEVSVGPFLLTDMADTFSTAVHPTDIFLPDNVPFNPTNISPHVYPTLTNPMGVAEVIELQTPRSVAIWGSAETQNPTSGQETPLPTKSGF